MGGTPLCFLRPLQTIERTFVLNGLGRFVASAGVEGASTFPASLRRANGTAVPFAQETRRKQPGGSGFVEVSSPPRAWGQSWRQRPDRGRFGSPPRAWGQSNRLSSTTHVAHRFTPTCVGTISRPTDHGLHGRRFTPTCVGTMRRPRAIRLAVCGSPPRAWGQSLHRYAAAVLALGSPPRAWGQSVDRT